MNNDKRAMRIAYYTAGNEASLRRAAALIEAGDADLIMLLPPPAEEHVQAAEQLARLATANAVEAAASRARDLLREGETDHGLVLLRASVEALATLSGRSLSSRSLI
jgi:hypothetical protein